MPNLTDISVVRSLCEKHGFTLSKGLGQNFIINPSVCPRMTEAAGVDKTCGVLEIGPGIGVLTKELALRAGKVVAVEVDDRLPPILAETLAEFDNVKVILNDVLKTDLRALIAEEFPGMRVLVCANLPYYITSNIVMKLLEEQLPVESITVMVQKEAAERLAAVPGSREAGAVTYAVQYYAEPQLMFTVQPGSFFPAPKVTSAVIRMDIRKQPPVAVADTQSYMKLIRAAFCQRRKTAVNSISAGLQLPKETVLRAVTACGLDERIRPEKLTLEDYARLQQALNL